MKESLNLLWNFHSLIWISNTFYKQIYKELVWFLKYLKNTVFSLFCIMFFKLEERLAIFLFLYPMHKLFQQVSQLKYTVFMSRKPF